MGTLSELQRATVAEELRQRQANKEQAKRVLVAHATEHNWSQEEQDLLSDMLGLDLPASTLHSGTPQAFNGGVS